jgi:hypothetical protein
VSRPAQAPSGKVDLRLRAETRCRWERVKLCAGGSNLRTLTTGKWRTPTTRRVHPPQRRRRPAPTSHRPVDDRLVSESDRDAVHRGDQRHRHRDRRLDRAAASPASRGRRRECGLAGQFESNVLTAVILVEALRPALEQAGGPPTYCCRRWRRCVAPAAARTSAMKVALHAWMFDLAAALCPHGGTANVVAPGFVPDTEFWAGGSPSRPAPTGPRRRWLGGRARPRSRIVGWDRLTAFWLRGQFSQRGFR